MTAPAPKTYLVTGAAGFIGYAVSRDLLARGDRVVGFDNLNDYYDPALKQARLDLLAPSPAFTFVRGDLADRAAVDSLFSRGPFDAVIHLAAQAGVRYSVTHPEVYGQSNLVGFLHVLEACRAARVPHLVYASSSSVYGLDAALPFCVHGPSAHPVSLYAATKRANELMAHAYSHLFAIPATGLRFFTVYGPWGRPDMALFKFTRAILADQPVDLYNHGRMKRDFTYVDDISRGVLLAADRPPPPPPPRGRPPPPPPPPPSAPTPPAPPPPGASTTSATTPPSNSNASSPSSKTPSDARPSKTTSPCSPATSNPPAPTSPTSPATPASPPPPPSKPAFPASSPGTATTTASSSPPLPCPSTWTPNSPPSTPAPAAT